MKFWKRNRIYARYVLTICSQIAVSEGLVGLWWRVGLTSHVYLGIAPGECTSWKKYHNFSRDLVVLSPWNPSLTGVTAAIVWILIGPKLPENTFFLRPKIFKWDEWFWQNFCGKLNKKLWSCFGVVFCFYFSVHSSIIHSNRNSIKSRFGSCY